MTRTKN